jgi:hypothetical protein
LDAGIVDEHVHATECLLGDIMLAISIGLPMFAGE